MLRKGALFCIFVSGRSTQKKIESVGRDKKKIVGKIKFSGVDDFQTQVMIFIRPSSTLPTTCVLSACLCFCASLCVCHS